MSWERIALLGFGCAALLGACLVDFDDFNFVNELNPAGTGGETAASTTDTTISIGSGEQASTGAGGSPATAGPGGSTCGQQVTPPGGNCPNECSDCPGGTTCRIDCNGTSECAAMTISCPAGFDCEVRCLGTASCSAATIDCPDTYGCNVICDADQACLNATLNCSSDGACSMDCQNAVDACTASQLQCGGNTCGAVCAGASGNPIVTCGPSCDCNPC